MMMLLIGAQSHYSYSEWVFLGHTADVAETNVFVFLQGPPGEQGPRGEAGAKGDKVSDNTQHPYLKYSQYITQ